MTDRRIPTDDELRSKLTPLQYDVTQKAGTERAFSGVYWDLKDEGVYRCIVCEEELFTSDTKYDSGSGWPRRAASSARSSRPRCSRSPRPCSLRP